MGKTWDIKNPAITELKDAFPEVPDWVLQLLANRGFGVKDDLHAFLSSEYEHIHDPFLMADMKQAVKRVLTAIKEREQVMVLGDYDADGVSGATIVFHMIAELTPLLTTSETSQFMPGADRDDSRLVPYIPDRTQEGYGVSDQAVEYAFQNGVNVLITIDCGVSNHDRLKFLKEHGVDVIVLDHHSIPETLPEAHSLLIPKRADDPYPFEELCGAGLAFKFAHALVSEARFQGLSDRLPEGYEKWYLDFAAIGTVGDMVPLRGENRILVTYGLYVLSKTKNSGLRELLRQMDIQTVVRQDSKERTTDEEITVHTVGFEIAPRINAAGRIDHANRAFELFRARTREEVEPLAQKLTELNAERKELTERVVREVEERLREKGDFADRVKLVFEGDKNWPIGVLGIAASRLMDTYYRPVVLYQVGEEYNTASARSIPGFHMAEAIQSVMPHLEAGGGHAQAGGMSFQPNKTETIKDQLQTRADQYLDKDALTPRIVADAEVKAEDVTWELYDLVNWLAPFGMGNPTPVFVLRKLRIERIKLVGSDKNHVKVEFKSQQHQGQPIDFQAIGFNLADTAADLFENEIVDVAFKLDVNEWRDKRELQLKLLDIRHEA